MKIRSSTPIVAGTVLALGLTGCGNGSGSSSTATGAALAAATSAGVPAATAAATSAATSSAAATSAGAVSSAAATAAAAASATGAATVQLPSSCKDASPTIGVALPNTVNPYYTAMQKSFQDNGKTLGFSVKLAIANDSDSNQLAQVQSFIQQKVCAVALNGVNSGPAAASVSALNKAHIPVFTVNVIVDQASLTAQHASFVQYVGADQVTGGKQMGTQVLKDLGATAKIVAGVVGDPDQVPTNQRDKGFADVLKADPNAKVLAAVNSKVDPNVALQVTSDLLQSNPAINVIFADTGPGAVGALQAIKQAGKQNKVTLYAFCAADTALTTYYKACSAQEPAQYAQVLLTNLKEYLAGKAVSPSVLEAPKVFLSGQTPGPGEVG
jgi:ribose transport system substrate-binding protein